MRTHSSARPNNLAAGGTFIRSAASLPGYRQDVELRQLEAFVAVATELHFGRAAERLHLAAPTLSELIRRLERELGTPLFTRTTQPVTLPTATWLAAWGLAAAGPPSTGAADPSALVAPWRQLPGSQPDRGAGSGGGPSRS